MDRDNLIATGWARGSVIDLSELNNSALIDALPPKVQTYLKGKKAYAIISLYDCALVHSSLESEPWLYIFIATEIESLHGNYLYGKNERILHLKIENTEDEIFIESNALTCNLSIDRKLLSILTPKFSLCSQELEIALTWISDRITRPVFSDEFNCDVKRKAEKVFKDNRMEFISSVYLQELVNESTTKNDISVFLTIPEQVGIIKYRDLKKEKQNGLTIEERMNSVFPLSKYSATTYLIPESEISISMLREYKKWSPDYFSDKVDSVNTEKAPFKNKCF